MNAKAIRQLADVTLDKYRSSNDLVTVVHITREEAPAWQH